MGEQCQCHSSPVGDQRHHCQSPPPRPHKSLRYYAVWTARFALPLLYLLATIQPVRIESPRDDGDLPDANGVEIEDGCQSAPSSTHAASALLVVTHSRHEYLARCLRSLHASHPRSRSEWPVVVSRDQQDGEHPTVDAVVRHAATSFPARNISLHSWQHAKSYDDSRTAQSSPYVDVKAYLRISRHYFWALSRLFSEPLGGRRIERVVIVEDDMQVAADFFNYFMALTPLLETDASVMCVSAWNDNGIAALATDASQLHRTDFFPGLGWMLTRALWDELRPKWPPMFWDDWLRHPDQMRGRHCIRPEVSRAVNFGATGVSQSFHYEKHVSKVVLSNTTVDFSRLDLSYLREDVYDHMIFSRMSNAIRLRFSNYLTSKPQDADVIAYYPDGALDAIAKRTGIMADHRNGVRRTAYKEVIVFPWNGHWAFAVARGWRPPPGYTLGARDCCP